MTKFLINNAITYISDQHRLIPVGKRGNEVVLNVPASRCLQLLLLRPGTVISQQDFFKYAWQNQGQYVTTNTFYQNISLLRKGLATAGIKEDIVRTVPKEGLLFSGTVLILDTEQENQEEQSEKDIELLGESGEKTTHNESKIESPTLKKPKNNILKIRRRLIYLNPLIFAAILTSILLFFVLRDNNQVRNFYESHRKISNVNQCSIYVNKSELRLTDDGYIRFLKSKNIVCRPEQFIYITDGKRGHSKVVQRCDTTPDNSYECEILYPLTTDIKL